MMSKQEHWVLWLAEKVFRTWWFDPVIATVSFGIFVHWHWYHERKLVDGTFVDILGYGPLMQSLLAYWIGIFIWTSIVPPPANDIPDGIPYTISQFFYLIAEVVTGIFLYDAIFFWIHWAFHEVPALRKFHARHHHGDQQRRQVLVHQSSSQKKLLFPVQSFDVLQHSLVDGALQVLVNILVQRRMVITGSIKTRLARALHNILVTWMLTESHSAAPTPYIWRRWLVGVREHYQHHTTTTQHNGVHHRYQQFFGYLDDWRMKRNS
jgi:hypothetical protein